MISEALGAHLGYLAVLTGTLLEGEVVLFLAGLAAQHGYLYFPIVVAVGAIGGFIADQSLFFIGRRYGNRLLARFPSVAARAPRVQALVKRWDVLAVFLVRFLYGMRIAGPVVIGSCGIEPWRLVCFNFIGAVSGHVWWRRGNFADRPYSMVRPRASHARASAHGGRTGRDDRVDPDRVAAASTAALADPVAV